MSNYLHNQAAAFRATYKRIDVGVLLMALYDLLFWVMSILFIMGIFYWINLEVKKLTFLEGGPQGLLTMQEAVASEALGSLRFFLAKFILAITLSIIVPFFLFTLSRYLIWGKMSHTSVGWRGYWRFTGAYALWLLFWAVPLAIVLAPLFVLANTAQAAGGPLNAPMGLLVLFWAVVLLLVYFTHHLFYYLSYGGRVFESIGNAFGRGFKKFHYRIFSGVLVVLVLIGWILLLTIVGTALKLQALAQALLVITSLLTLLYFSLARLYFFESVNVTEHLTIHPKEHPTAQKKGKMTVKKR